MVTSTVTRVTSTVTRVTSTVTRVTRMITRVTSTVTNRVYSSCRRSQSDNELDRPVWGTGGYLHVAILLL